MRVGVGWGGGCYMDSHMFVVLCVGQCGCITVYVCLYHSMCGTLCGWVFCITVSVFMTVCVCGLFVSQ